MELDHDILLEEIECQFEQVENGYIITVDSHKRVYMTWPDAMEALCVLFDIVQEKNLGLATEE